MKVVIQRCIKGSVHVNDKLINDIKEGFIILVGISKDDTELDLNYIVKKVLNLRVFDDENGIMNRSIKDINGEILSISQFTLLANTKDGSRPSYINAMDKSDSKILYEQFNNLLNKEVTTKEGVFGANMKVTIINDGPVTIIIDSKNK